jgi:RimJ/RimL family protein N-acetyltransferase
MMSSPLPVPIETERLILRFNEEGDLDDTFAFQGRDDATRWVTFDTRTREEVAEVLERRKPWRTLEKDDDALIFAVVERASGRLIGEMYFFARSMADKHAEIGYIFHPDVHGKGYATEASRAVLAIAFDHYGLHRVSAECDVRNPASYRVMEKLGMRREAHFVEHMWFKGEWSDSYVYAILDREWRAQAGSGRSAE